MEEFDAIIIGAGASGTMCALSADNNKRIALIDTASFPAKKLLVTGNGRCNLTNVKLASRYYNQDISKYFAVYDNAQTLNFFEDLGLLINVDPESRVYPFSNSAKTVVDVLFKEIKRRNIFLFCEQNFIKISKIGEMYCVKTTYYALFAKKVVVATGGQTDMQLFADFQINTKAFMPSLCALKTQSTKRLSGLKLSDVMVTAICEGEEKKQKGELLFKDSGLSGIVIFNLSTLFARKSNYTGTVSIDIMPDITEQDVYALLVERAKKGGSVKDLLTGMFHSEINKEILWRTNIDEEKHVEQVTEEEILSIAQTIKNLNYSVCGYYDNNQVYSGGVLLSDLDESLQSIKNKGLYFCGEVCDVDGECGGYNLQWAWTSGYIVGKNI